MSGISEMLSLNYLSQDRVVIHVENISRKMAWHGL